MPTWYFVVANKQKLLLICEPRTICYLVYCKKFGQLSFRVPRSKHDLFNKHFNDVTLQLFRSSLFVDHTLLFNLCNSKIETDLVVSQAHTVQYTKLQRTNTCKKKHPSSWLITNYNPPTRQPSGKFYFSNTIQEDHLRKQQPSIQNGTNPLKKSVI